MFHPLITPLTTYMYTTDIQAEGTVSATDEERLPPGGFSLRHGFPGWFGRGARRSAEKNRGSSSLQTPRREDGARSNPGSAGMWSGSAGPTPGAQGAVSTASGKVTTYDVLRYIRSAFDDEAVLDRIPLEAAGNPGAWHAWRSYRAKAGVLLPSAVPEKKREANENSTSHDGLSEDEGSTVSSVGVPEGYQRLAGGTPAAVASRRPGEWNWDGVWEVRVKKGTEGSLAEGTLFGREAGDDLIRFLNLDAEQSADVMEKLRKSLETVEPQRRGIV
jgi:hypothetical protein